ncbi:MAG TPA: phosphoribosylanthranilate isomerase [Thiobacillaceae bacterium]|nr:phosphoribosylanthranilate isomerase [Thiobacillaceae bacterium]HNA81537.1 phosphoribosylanthranilate isomerase [Thiobacillaceae bacterium]HNF88075.1 phosphoribosylanthranilate isomerase [Thiobacillaceae bacterium]HNH88660.1 phosphoribosylanthranilate isomerase [Thiobacillaceae bacterium]HNI08207.1 phosphoribosylanthranilate isomerase [Thiobacillaceae bacterium]
MTRTKICGITRVEDALAAAHAGADAIGLVFVAKSPRHVTPMQAAEIGAALPPFVTRVALFVNPDAAQVEAVLGLARPDVLQFHGEESPEFCRSFGLPYLKAARVRPGVDLLQFATLHADAQGLLLDAWSEGVHGGTGERFDWALIPPDLPRPIVLAGGLHPGIVAEAVRVVGPWAVDVSSGVEAAKGIKDAAKIAAFIKEVRNADV